MVGAGIGLGMMAKYTMLFLVCGVVVGVLFTGMRRYLRSGWLWLGVLVAVGIFAAEFCLGVEAGFCVVGIFAISACAGCGRGTDRLVFGGAVGD